ncbi:MAG: formylglycine-generating enzyme family protein, partial [Chloroflexaceae bacterium]|nr:formylglycine-generating enzyme family protein [Chloroflexaceae bacterium]
RPWYWDDPQWNGADQPVVGVSWYEAVAYARWLSDQTGREYRLPTEAEWEKAARGSEGRIWPWGNEWRQDLANTAETGLEQTLAVGSYPDGASPYGALDMAGNAWEWCATRRIKTYPYELSNEWTDDYLEGTEKRIMRGGSHIDIANDVRTTNRNEANEPGGRNFNVGFRLVSYSPL